MQHDLEFTPTLHEVRVDIAKQIHHLEMRHGFSDVDILHETDFGSVDREQVRAFGAYRALKQLVWRMDNAAYLGKVQT